jgi:hypothetical protein
VLANLCCQREFRWVAVAAGTVAPNRGGALKKSWIRAVPFA